MHVQDMQKYEITKVVRNVDFICTISSRWPSLAKAKWFKQTICFKQTNMWWA